MGHLLFKLAREPALVSGVIVQDVLYPSPSCRFTAVWCDLTQKSRDLWYEIAAGSSKRYRLTNPHFLSLS
jgi:hypothetical protein